MNHTKSLIKIVTIAFLLLVVAVVAFLVFKPSPEAPKDNGSSGGQPKLQSLQTQDIAAEDFVYQKPEGWAKLSKELLDSSAATSGIGLPSTTNADALPTATFTVKTASSTPKNAKDLKDSMLTELKKLSSFELISTVTTEVNGKTGQRFTYRFGDKEKTKQDLSVIVNKQKTFFLLFSSTDVDFDAKSTELTNILAAFEFK